LQFGCTKYYNTPSSVVTHVLLKPLQFVVTSARPTEDIWASKFQSN